MPHLAWPKRGRYPQILAMDGSAPILGSVVWSRPGVRSAGVCDVQVTITKDDTILLDGAGAKDTIQERCEQIREAASTTTSDYDRDKLQERLAKLSGGVAVLKIGGASEVGSRSCLAHSPRPCAAQSAPARIHTTSHMHL